MVKKFLNLCYELYVSIKNKEILKSELQTQAYGLKFVGQGYMIDSYASLDHKNFITGLKQEVDFIKRYKNSKKGATGRPVPMLTQYLLNRAGVSEAAQD